MSIINQVGKSSKSMFANSSARRLAKMGLAVGGTGAIIQGFGKGLSTGGQLSNSIQQGILGDDGLDRSIFGRDVGMGTLMMGTKSLGFMGVQASTLGVRSSVAGFTGGIAGGAAGATVGLVAGGAIAGPFGAIGAIAGGMIGSTAGHIAGKLHTVKPYMNSGLVTDYNKYRNNMPYVPGDVVFGAYNTRH